VVVRLEVRGQVQGVGFRWFVREGARRLGLSGWVKNREDGSVEALASGNDEAVALFVAMLERGPDGARVDVVTRLPVGDSGALETPFTVIR
jgi:acylphosphatase